MNIHLNVLMNEIDGIAEKDLIEANSELILYSQWYLDDFMTVIIHLIVVFILGAPMISVTIG
jgi:hypothetical protein